jgi:hypothetical protein
MPIIPALRNLRQEYCGSASLFLKDSLKKSKQNKTRHQAWWSGSSSKSACLARLRPCVQTSVLLKKNKNKNISSQR